MEKEIAATASIGPSEPGMRSTAPSASEGGLESLETYSLSAIHIPSRHADDKIGIGPFATDPSRHPVELATSQPHKLIEVLFPEDLCRKLAALIQSVLVRASILPQPEYSTGNLALGPAEPLSNAGTPPSLQTLCRTCR